MEAAIRSVQVGPPGQRADTGPTQPPPTISYPSRIPSGASPIHRPVDTPQSYNKGGTQPSQTSRSAASPLSPPRPGGAATTYPPFSSGVPAREAPVRYVQQSAYSTIPFRENPYARVPQVPQQVDYMRAAPVVSVPNSLSVSVGPPSSMETATPPQQQQQQQQRPRISLLPHATEYLPPRYIAPPDPGGPPAFKKIRLGDPSTNATPPPLLNVDTRDPPSTGAYHPQVEAISPTLPINDPAEEFRATKDELLQQISKVDLEIVKAEKAIANLKKKEVSLEETTAKPAAVEENQEVQPKHRSLAQKIYAENRKKALEAHRTLSALGPPVELPLYNQPSDVDVCKEIIQHHQVFKSRLLLHLRKIKAERAAKNTALAEKYTQLSQEWLRRVEKVESSAKRKAKEAKNREFFEKVFPELRKQREDKERFNRVGSRIKSEADLEEIMDGLHEQQSSVVLRLQSADRQARIQEIQRQAMEDKKMRSYAVIPPLMLDAAQRRCVFYNENGALQDMEADFKERKNLNVWTAGEKEVFKEKFLQHPKNFGAISASLDRKSAQDCVRYYYLSKKTENFKQLLRKSRQRTRSSRNPQKSNQSQSQCIVDALTTGVTTRLQREQQQKTGGRDRAANSTTSSATSTTITTNNSLNSNSSTSPPVQLTTTTTGPSLPCSSSSICTPPPAPSCSSDISNSLDTTTTTNVNSTTTNPSSMDISTELSSKPSICTLPRVDTKPTEENLANDTQPSPMDVCADAGQPPSVTTPTSSITSTTSSTTSKLSSPSSTPTITTTTSSTMATNEKEQIPPANVSSSPPLVTATTTSATLAITDIATTTSTTTLSATSNQSTKQPAVSTTFVNVTITNTPNGVKTEIVTSLAKSAAGGILVNSDGLGKELIKDEFSKAVDGSGSTSSSIMNANFNEIHDGIVKEEETSETKKRRKDPSESTTEEDNAAPECKEKILPCFVCKELCTRTRPLEKSRCQQYGIPEDQIQPGARVCSSCQCKSVRNRYASCPLPTCPNPKDHRVKRFRNLPPRLFELAPDIRDPLIQEFQIPPNVTKCCSACLIKIKRKLGPHLLGTNLTDEEIAKFKQQLQDVGPKWQQLADSLGKSPVALKSFYFHYKKKYSFDVALNEYFKLHPNEDRRPVVTDGDESDMSASSGDEREAGSDTASAESPNNPIQSNTIKEEIQIIDTIVPPANKPLFEDDRLLPPLAQAPRKQKALEEYDSSATETADEENETSPANRHSPKVLLYPNQTTITMVPSTLQNGPRESVASSELNMRDVMLNVIERTLKTGQQPPPPKPNPPSSMKQSIDSRPDITFVREYRNEVPKQLQQTHTQSPQQLQQQQQPSAQQQLHRPSQPEGLATLSVVNSHGHSQQVLTQHPHAISTQIAATITPVHPSPSQQQQPSQQPNQQQSSLEHHHQQQQRTDLEPQTLDLSIKKPLRENFPPPAHSKLPPSTGVTMYRSDPHTTNSQNIPAQNSTSFLSYHPDMSRSIKSPSIYVSAVPSQISISQQSQAHNIPGHRGNQPPHQTQQQQQQQQQQNLQSCLSKTKLTPKLSPKMQHQQQSSQQSGPKGSITHGTPVNTVGPPIHVQSSTTLSPRFDSILRQTPPNADKLGSITQGTPVHLPSHHLPDKRVYDYYKNNRHSPAQPPTQQPNSQAAPFGPYGRTTAYSLDQQQQLSSRQIIMNDYITSQQMHGQRSGRSDKESPSPRASSIAGSPASLYYEKEQQRSRAEYMSRASPAEHTNSTPSPHRTPPPQRQGVIQRHTGSKPPSPAANRMHILQQHHYPPPGHEAFSSLVDVAVQQPLLPVPHKDEKRQTVNVSTPAEHAAAHHDIRYHQQIAREQMAMQIHQQQQQMRQQHHSIQQQQQQNQQQQNQQQQQQHQMDLQRRQQSATAYRDQLERERREEQYRLERQDRDRHAQVERERAERHHHQEQRLAAERDRNLQIERERMDRERIDRAREQIVQNQNLMEEQERERREASSRLLVSVAGPGFLRDPPSRGLPDRDRERERPVGPRSSTDGTLTAANLIDAIITHQINQSVSDPPVSMGRDGHRPNFFTARDIHQSITENNGKSHSPNVINIDLDSDRSRTQVVTKSITLGELTDSIIAKDFSPHPFTPLRQPFFYSGQDSIVTTDQWKYNRRMQQQKEEQHHQQQQQQQQQQPASNKNPSGRSSVPDERQIIRMAQPPSPRNKQFHESASPPDGHFYQIAAPTMQNINRTVQPPPPHHQFALHCYVKNRIVEAMRTEDEKRADETSAHDRRITPQSHHKDNERDRSSTPGEMIIDEDVITIPSSSASSSIEQHHNTQYTQPPVTSFAPTATYTYPFNALNVSGTGSVQLSQSMPPSAQHIDEQKRNQHNSQQEPKPLLCSQYEALSDED